MSKKNIKSEESIRHLLHSGKHERKWSPGGHFLSRVMEELLNERVMATYFTCSAMEGVLYIMVGMSDGAQRLLSCSLLPYLGGDEAAVEEGSKETTLHISCWSFMAVIYRILISLFTLTLLICSLLCTLLI